MSASGISIQYLSAGANRQTAVADWSRRGVLAFGADSNIALWLPSVGIDPSSAWSHNVSFINQYIQEKKPSGVSCLLSGHSETVKALTFLFEEDGDESSFLVSGADDKTIVIWKSTLEGSSFESIQSSSAHTGPINCITSLRRSSRWLIATGSADATIKIWDFDGSTLQLIQSIQTAPRYFPLSLDLSLLDLDTESVVLASAGTRDTIQILTSEPTANGHCFSLQTSLRGHEGWIRSLSFTRDTASQGRDLLLASASQDKYMRIWRFHQGEELSAAVAAGADPASEAYLPGKSPSNKAYWLKTAGKDFSVTFEALLLGHEDWIYSAKWHTQRNGTLQLLSTSADNSLAIWEADPTSGIWVSMVRLGEISREKGATTATGSTGGFWTGLWSPDGTSVACLGRTGSWRRWEHDVKDDRWKPCVAITGHTKAVTGISWSGTGEHLLSTSSDQTTRLHATWTATDTWHEMSRPQIHGYDLNCIDSLGSTQFVSGADEKLMRVFTEPKAVAHMLHRLAGIDHVQDTDMPDAANMPVLGLSNKAIDAMDEDAEIQPVDDRDREAIDPASIVKKSFLDIDHAPYEETLSRHTLWPETEKLYGHGYEISCLAASHDGKLIASACKASSLNHAVIRLFETDRWTEIRPPLTAHSLTATRLRFSSDDRFLLSVGRDRQWAVFERVSPTTTTRDQCNDPEYQLLQSDLKGHSRMILDCAWAPIDSERAPLFATAGRDKQVRVWTAQMNDNENKWQFSQSATIPSYMPVTSVDFLQQTVNDQYMLAVGNEAGHLSIYTITTDGKAVTQTAIPQKFHLPKAILQLAWRPAIGTNALDNHYLAIAGEDSSLRLYSVSENL